MPVSPLVKAIQQILENSPDGLSPTDIRHNLLEKLGFRATPPEIREAFQGHRDIFIQLSDGRWASKSIVEVSEIVTGISELPRERGNIVKPYLADLSSLDSYIVFDLETTGLKSDRDRIIQIAAIRIINGKPSSITTSQGETLSSVFSEYINLEDKELSYGLKLKLGFIDHPEWQTELDKAQKQGQVLECFKEWVGDLPLLAHNIRFDLQFLQKAAAVIGWQINNPLIDSMELACLACPDLRTYRLEELARFFGVSAEGQGGDLVQAWASLLDSKGFTWSGFHNAVVDVLVLAATIPDLFQRILERVTRNTSLAFGLCTLMPNLAHLLGVQEPVLEIKPEETVRQLVNVELAPDDRLFPHEISYLPADICNEFEEMVQKNGLKQRRTQFEMVEAVSRSLLDDRYMMIEAPTGTGKTFAYLYPSILWARSQSETIVISTYTKLLQDQLGNDLKKIQNFLDPQFVFRSQVLKGMNNYACLERIAAIFAQTDITKLDEEERFAWLYLFSWTSVTSGGALDELSYWAIQTFPVLGWLIDDIRAERGECSHERCEQCQICFHNLAFTKAQTADIVVMNHALLLSKEWGDSGIPFSRVIVDEAHNLEDAATDAATDEVSDETISYLVNRLVDYRTGQGLLVRLRDKVVKADGQRLIAVAFQKRNILAKLSLDFGNRLRRYVELNRTKIDPRYGAKLTLESDPRLANPTSWKPTQEAREQLVFTLYDTGKVIRELYSWVGDNPLPVFNQETLNELNYLADKLIEHSVLLDEILRVGYDRLVKVHWIEVERVLPFREGEKDKEYEGPYRWATKRAPVRLGPYLSTHLYKDKRSIVMTSATLRTTREVGFGFILNRLGLTSIVRTEDAISLPPELDYSRAMFIIARYMRSDARPSEIQNFVDEVGKELGWFFRFTGGNGLGLFTARERMSKVFDFVEPTLGEHNIPVECQDVTGSPMVLLDELKSRPGAVLLGLKRFWEGVDVPGPNLSYVVMEKLPFPLMGEPVIRARSQEIVAGGGHEFVDYILPLMLIDFKQGFGRLIRDESDIGAVLLLDKRVWNREYRRDLLEALPGADLPIRTSQSPRLLEDEKQLSRKRVYQAIAEHMAQAPPPWHINLEQMLAILADIPEEFLTRLEQLLAELQIPDITPLEKINEIWMKVLRGVRELFQFVDWRPPEQEDVVKAILTGQDAIVILPTGSGKSFTFQLPALLRDGTTLVFSPLKALMKDQVDKLLDKGLSVADRVDSTQTAEEQERVYQRMREGSTRLVYIAPERIRDPKLIAALKVAKNVTQIVVDEAHCVHMWGQSFRPDYLYISSLVEMIKEKRGRRPPVAALTATATPRIRQAIADRLHLRDNYVLIQRNPDRPELRFIVYNSKSPGFQIRSRRDKMRILMRILRSADRKDENAIVYVSTTREAERLARNLESKGIDARYYHGKMDDQARKDVQDMFLEGQVKIIVATKAFGMGIDKPDIRYVIHFQIPGDLESYFQEAGRAGRDGKISWCVLLFHPDDLWIHENYFIPKSLPEQEQVYSVLVWLKKRIQASNWKGIFIDPREMADALGFDEEGELGIHIHLLEELGFIARDVDATLKASVRLLTPIDKVIEQVMELAGTQIAQVVKTIFQKQNINPITRSELRIVEGAIEQGIDPLALDSVLYELALGGMIIYRSFARAYTMRPGPSMQSGKRLAPNISEVQKIREELESNLVTMKHYGASLKEGHCLREEILNYLGYEKPPTRAEECCSLCDVNLAVPWTSEPSVEDLTDPGKYQDAKYTILKAIDWNAGLVDMRGRSPYGIKTLSYILTGNDFMATRYQDDQQRRQARRDMVISSPYFGVLDGLSGGDEVIVKLIDDLRIEGFITLVQRQLEIGTYDYPIPTEQGSERLKSGKLFIKY